MSLRIANVDVVLGSTITPGDKGSLPYAAFNPSTQELSQGHRLSPEHKAFEVDTIFEKDITLSMRDGVKLYADIFRPKTEDKVPAILIWIPYGKTGNGPNSLDMLPGRFGVPQSRVSGYEKFEGLDPALWSARGYAIVNADLRGSWDSEGIVPWLGAQDGKDGHDAIEHIAKLDWCTGKVALAGNSWLAMVQWHIAAQQPPSLAAIAPWEGAADFYRDTLCRGGIPYPYDTMWGFLQTTMVGRNGAEAAVEILAKYPLFNDYWEDKRSKLEEIKVPA